ncbi:MAG TPA: hypothetical protein DCE18_18205 [Syntrophobacteraceae bacterium]|nr:hypothetical protein [Syntrophobacteraceae bacterium]
MSGVGVSVMAADLMALSAFHFHAGCGKIETTVDEGTRFMKQRLLVFLCLSGYVVMLAAGCGTVTSQQSISAATPPLSGQYASTSAQNGSDSSIEIPAPKYEMLIPNHSSIEAWVRRFSQEKHKSFQTQLVRSVHYAMPAQAVFEQRGLPKDLVFVALVESGFSPMARSHANAVGMWQFISTTGKRYGLEQNQWIDERRHPLKAARAAADYLNFLYDTFGSWSLALAAYNAGEKAVQGALDQSGAKTFWDLAERGYLPQETRDYVPKVFATVKIIRNPRQYGFWYDPGHYVPKHETVPIPGSVKLSWVGKQIGVPEASLQDCNPELCKPVTPPGCSSYELCVPVGKGEDLAAVLANGPPPEEKNTKHTVSEKSTATASYKVKHGDSWVGLARKYKCSAQTLAALNGMSPSRPLKAGQTLKIPAGKSTIAAATGRTKGSKDKVIASANDKRKAPNSGQKLHQPIHYPVRQGDTLSSIADRFHIPLKTLCAQNKLSANQKLVPGNRLTIHTR